MYYAIGIAIVIGSVVAYKMLTPKPEIDITEASSELTINASKLYHDFSENETTANKGYAGKVLEVKGILKKVEKEGTQNIQLSLDAEADLGSVICNLQVVKSEEIEGLEIGKPITIKGVCTGYLFDVVIDHGMIII